MGCWHHRVLSSRSSGLAHINYCFLSYNSVPRGRPEGGEGGGGRGGIKFCFAHFISREAAGEMTKPLSYSSLGFAMWNLVLDSSLV